MEPKSGPPGKSSSGNENTIESLVPLVYDELRSHATRLLKREKPNAILQATALVHEVYLRLVEAHIDWKGKTHFKAVAAVCMRRFLREYHRDQNRLKRGGRWKRITISESQLHSKEVQLDMQTFVDLLDCVSKIGERKARIVELKLLGGLTQAEIAETLQLSERTVERDWRLARAWLIDHLKKV